MYLSISNACTMWLCGIVLISVLPSVDSNECKAIETVMRTFERKEMQLSKPENTARLCAGSQKCCSHAQEHVLLKMADDDLLRALRDVTYPVRRFFSQYERKLSDAISKAMQSAASKMDDQFTYTYGLLYQSHKKLFNEQFYNPLDQYLEGEDIDLLEQLKYFAEELPVKAFYIFIEKEEEDAPKRFRACLSDLVKTWSTTIHSKNKVVHKLSQSVAAGRTIKQALSAGKYVMDNVLQVKNSGDCRQGYTRYKYCVKCNGHDTVRNCHGYCHNVMSGCWAQLAELTTAWKQYTEATVHLLSKMENQLDIEVHLAEMGVTVSSYVMDIQTAIGNFTDMHQHKLKQCGDFAADVKRINSRRRRNSGDRAGDMQPVIGPLLRDIKRELKEFQKLWTNLAELACETATFNALEKGAPRNQKCWNGNSIARYRPSLINGGLAAHTSNPEVSTETGDVEHTAVTNAKNMLNVMKTSLQQAAHGEAVTYIKQLTIKRPTVNRHPIRGSGDDGDDEDDYSGSGSGDFDPRTPDTPEPAFYTTHPPYYTQKTRPPVPAHASYLTTGFTVIIALCITALA